MAEKKRTVGDWQADDETGMIFTCPRPLTKFVIAFTESGSFDEQCANARLIAASPDLLAALQAIVRHGELANIDAGDPFSNYGGKKHPSKDVFAFPRHMLNEIDAAIAKAEGKP